MKLGDLVKRKVVVPPRDNRDKAALISSAHTGTGVIIDTPTEGSALIYYPKVDSIYGMLTADLELIE